MPANHPLRGVRALLDEALESMHRDFERVYAEGGRASIPPERLVRALTLQILYSIRSERLLCEQLDYNLLFRWFVGLSVDEPVWDHSTFTKNRERLIEAKVARKLLRRVVRKARAARLLSNEHFSVDGTLIESWAAVKSMRRRDGRDEPPGPGRNPSVDFRGEKRSNETHVSPSDPEAKLYRKANAHPVKLYFMGHVLMEHRHGLPVDVEVTEANGFAEREAALAMLDRLPGANAARSPPTKPMTSPRSSPTAASAGLPRTSPVTTPGPAVRRLMGAPRVTPAISGASASANESKRALAGARTAARCAR